MSALTAHPRLIVDTGRVRRNVELAVSACRARGIEMMGVTKGVHGDETLARLFVDAGVTALGDSRIDNLHALSKLELDAPLWLLRAPSPSEADACVSVASGSLQSDIVTLRRVAEQAVRRNIVHRVLLMVDLDTGREGLHPDDVPAVCREVDAVDGLRLEGLGAYFDYECSPEACRPRLSRLVELARGSSVRARIVSGGASNVLELAMDGTLPSEINQLRLGTAPLLGLYSSAGPRPIDGWERDTMLMESEVIEVKSNGRDVLLALGYLDAPIEQLYPVQASATLLRQSSDHTVLRTTAPLSVGETVRFRLGYQAMAVLTASRYTAIEYRS